MAQQFFVKTEGEEHGPFTFLEIEQKAKDGQIQLDTPVRRGENEWAPAAQFRFLADAIESRNRSNGAVHFSRVVGAIVLILGIAFVVGHSVTPATEQNGPKTAANTAERSQQHVDTPGELAESSGAGGQPTQSQSPATAKQEAKRQSVGEGESGRPTDEDAPESLPDLIDRLKPSIAKISTSDGNGSGFVVHSFGMIVTNHHVVEGCKRATARFPNGQRAVVTGFVRASPENDLVLLKVDRLPSSARPLELADKPPRIGEKVVALGYPSPVGFNSSKGIVSGTMREGTTHSVKIDAAINPGNSGGPLIAINSGEVIGVNTSSLIKAENINFAVTAQHVRQLLKGRLDVVHPLSSLPESDHAVARTTLPKGKRNPTLGYWKELRRLVFVEQSERKYKRFDNTIEAFNRAADAIDRRSARDVDPELLGHAMLLERLYRTMAESLEEFRPTGYPIRQRALQQAGRRIDSCVGQIVDLQDRLEQRYDHGFPDFR